MTLQDRIIAELKVRPIIEPKEEIRKSVDFMKEYARKNPFLNGFGDPRYLPIVLRTKATSDIPD